MKFLKIILPLFAILLTSNVVLAQPQVYTQNTSGPALCDGVAWIDSSFNASTTQWMGGGAVLQNGGLYIYNLCPGSYVVTASSLLGNSFTLTFTIGSGNTNPCANFSISISATDATTSTSCDGSAQAFVSGGTAPYTYTWSGMSSNTNSWTNLCMGTYNCCVSDANGCLTCDVATIGDASALDSVLVFNNNPFPGGIVSGVLATDSLEDCSINYQNIASGSVTNSVAIGTDSLLVTWTLLDSTGVVAATYNVVYNIPNTASGIYGLTLVVYCSQKAMNYNTIVINDQVMLGANELGILNNDDLSVINPFNNQLAIRLSSISNGSVQLVNFAGQMVLNSEFSSSDNVVLNTEMLPQGVYVLTVRNERETITRTLLKK